MRGLLPYIKQLTQYYKLRKKCIEAGPYHDRWPRLIILVFAFIALITTIEENTRRLICFRQMFPTRAIIFAIFVTRSKVSLFVWKRRSFSPARPTVRRYPVKTDQNGQWKRIFSKRSPEWRFWKTSFCCKISGCVWTGSKTINKNLKPGVL